MAGWLGEVYRELVRQSPLQRKKILSGYWVSSKRSHFISNHLTPTSRSNKRFFQCDLYSQDLMTMSDDEFFGSTATRNPLTLDELASFGRQLLKITFTLHWRDDTLLRWDTSRRSKGRIYSDQELLSQLGINLK